MSIQGIHQGPRASCRFRLLLLLGTVPLTSAAGFAHAQCQYEVTVIQPDECPIFGIPPIVAEGLSNAGHVVGWHLDCTFLDDEAFIWTRGLGVFDLPIPARAIGPRAVGVNSSNQVVGWVNLPDDNLSYVAFVYQNSILITLGTLPGGNFSRAAALNERGQVVGTWGDFVTGDPDLASFLWQDNELIDLNLPLGSSSEARDINDMGQVVGYMGESINIDSHAYIWDDGAVTDLGIAPGAISSAAVAINNRGQVLVLARYLKDESLPLVARSFVWDDGQWTDLGVLPGFSETYAYDMNDSCQVVGVCRSSPSSQGFYWQAGSMIPAIDLVSRDVSDISGIEPNAINSAGQIAAFGGIDGGPAAFLLTPIDRPRGDINNDCTVGVSDLLWLLSTWGPCPASPVPCSADIDENGQVGVLDLLIMLSNWTV